MSPQSASNIRSTAAGSARGSPTGGTASAAAMLASASGSGNAYANRSPRPDLRREISTARLDLGQLPPRPAFDRETSFRLLGHDSPSRYYGTPSPAPSSSGMEMLLNAIEASPSPTFQHPVPSSSTGASTSTTTTTTTATTTTSLAPHLATAPMVSPSVGLHRSSSAQSNSSQPGGMPSLRSITRALYPGGQGAPLGIVTPTDDPTATIHQPSETLHMPFPSPGGNQLSITSLLEASQQLASPPMKGTTDWSKQVDPPSLNVDGNLANGNIDLSLDQTSGGPFSPTDYDMSFRSALPMGPYGMIGPYALPISGVPGMKRKFEETSRSDLSGFGWDHERPAESKTTRIRRALQLHSTFLREREGPRPGDGSTHASLTISCSYARVAQKSYGTEKRYLCPPPVVSYTKGGRPVADLHQLPRIFVKILGENGEQMSAMEGTTDNDGVARFRTLHVSGTAKAKTFQLGVSLYAPRRRNGSQASDRPPRYGSAGRNDGAEDSLTASFVSTPISIISKPSKMTAKARNKSACITSGQPISLFNRINSQTVRTKYMCVEDGQLCARNTRWSELGIRVVRREVSKGNGHESLSKDEDDSSSMVTYGSVIYLEDIPSGTRSDHLIIRKVEKNRVVDGAYGPVSQMQKIALQRETVDHSGITYYLSAAGQGPNAMDNEDDLEGGPSAMLTYQAPRTEYDGNHGQVDILDDHLSWSIVGITRFERTYVDTLGASATSTLPITPFPRVETCDGIRPGTHAVSMKVCDFLTSDYAKSKAQHSPSTQDVVRQPMEVWLGPLGPLTSKVSKVLGATNFQSHGGSMLDDRHVTVTINLPSVDDVWQCLYADLPIESNENKHLAFPNADALAALVSQPPATVDPTLALGPDLSRSQGPGNQITLSTTESGPSYSPDTLTKMNPVLGSQALGANHKRVRTGSNAEGNESSGRDMGGRSMTNNGYFDNLSSTGRLNMSLSGATTGGIDSINPADAFFGTSQSQRPPFIMPDLHDPNQSLPLMFVRPDGIAYSTQWAVRCELANAPNDEIIHGQDPQLSVITRGGPLNEWKLQLFPLDSSNMSD